MINRIGRFSRDRGALRLVSRRSPHFCQINYEQRELVSDWELCVGSPNAPELAARERTRRGRLRLIGLAFWVIETLEPQGNILGGYMPWVARDGPLLEAGTDLSRELSARVPPGHRLGISRAVTHSRTAPLIGCLHVDRVTPGGGIIVTRRRCLPLTNNASPETRPRRSSMTGYWTICPLFVCGRWDPFRQLPSVRARSTTPARRNLRLLGMYHLQGATIGPLGPSERCRHHLPLLPGLAGTS